MCLKSTSQFIVLVSAILVNSTFHFVPASLENANGNGNNEGNEQPDNFDRIPQKVLGLVMKYVTNDEQLAQVLYHLSTDKGAGKLLQTLEAVVDREIVFAKIMKRLVQDKFDLKRGGLSHIDDEQQQDSRHILHSSLKPSTVNNGQASLHEQQFKTPLIDTSSQAAGVLEALDHMQPEYREQVRDAAKITANLPQFSKTSQLLALTVSAQSHSKKLHNGLMVYELGYGVYEKALMLWSGEISGFEFLKNTAGNVLNKAAGFVGALAGTLAGSSIYPGPGAFLGAVIGEDVTHKMASTLSDWLAWITPDSKPKEDKAGKGELLEDAFRYLDLPSTASNDDIKYRYSLLEFEYHPDNGGNIEDWSRLHYYMGVIKASREAKTS